MKDIVSLRNLNRLRSVSRGYKLARIGASVKQRLKELRIDYGARPPARVVSGAITDARRAFECSPVKGWIDIPGWPISGGV